MAHVLLCLVLLFPLPLTSPKNPPLLAEGDLEDLKAVPSEVIVHTTACSATCGLGLRQQELCPMREGQVEERGCRMRWVRCLDTWQCGLQTVTGPEGSRLELDCLGEVMEAMGRYSFRVSWRYARGIITSDDSLFALYYSPQLDRVVLAPLQEDDAGTYRCEVQDSTFHLVKRVYKGVRVVPLQVLSLDYDSALVRWDEADPSHSPNLTVVTGSPYTGRVVRNILLISLAASVSLAGLILLGLLALVQGRRWWRSRGGDQVLLARLLPPPKEGELEEEEEHLHL